MLTMSKSIYMYSGFYNALNSYNIKHLSKMYSVVLTNCIMCSNMPNLHNAQIAYKMHKTFSCTHCKHTKAYIAFNKN